jgi:deazaflavin-dependent oxidoreductase (nitroreductase family)
MNKLVSRVMRGGNSVAVSLYRRSGGRLGGSAKGVEVLLLTVAGRRTGRRFTVPVAYIEHDGGYVVTGSGGGMKNEPQWFLNLRSARDAEIEMGRTSLPVDVRIADGAERDRLWHDVVLARAPFFGKYQEKAGRVIPIATLTPRP